MSGDAAWIAPIAMFSIVLILTIVLRIFEKDEPSSNTGAASESRSVNRLGSVAGSLTPQYPMPPQADPRQQNWH
jgi:hypothetical protein